MINLFKQIFIWWSRQTIGTSIYTLFTGKLIGEDKFKNKYYTNRKGKRWVIYNSEVEASKIPPSWHRWIHFITNKIPEKNEPIYFWQKNHVENLTGTNKAYKPEGSLHSDSKKSMKKYETWNP